MAEASTLKLSFWNLFVPETAILAPAANQGDAALAYLQLNSEVASGMHKEIFRWRMQEDPLGGVADTDDRERLKTALFENLGVHVSPDKRAIGVLRAFVEAAEAVLDKESAVEWSSSQSHSFDEEERHVNALLALVCHLKWLIEVFDEQPNVSVTAR